MELSVCTILRNEAENVLALAQCLPLGDIEWIVADTGSTDDTVSLLLQQGVSPFFFPWCDDFSAARNATLDRATRKWVLWLDADDRLEPEFFSQLKSLLAGDTIAWRLVVESPREEGSRDLFRQIRLFPNLPDLRFEGRVHEQVGSAVQRLNLAVQDSDLPIRHLGYNSLKKREAKRERNFRLLAKEIEEHPGDAAVTLEWGNALCQAGKTSEARQAYLGLLRGNAPEQAGRAPENPCLKMFPALIAESYEQDGLEVEAEAWHCLSLTWEPEYLRSRYWLAKRQLSQGNWSVALNQLRILIGSPVVVGKIACDNATVRRNALGLAILTELASVGQGSRLVEAPLWLDELLEDPMSPLPIEVSLVIDILCDRGDWKKLIAFGQSRNLNTTPSRSSLAEITRAEDVAEALLEKKRWEELESFLQQIKSLKNQSGILLAFDLALQEQKIRYSERDATFLLPHYFEALNLFPEDPTLLSNLCEYVNRHRLWKECETGLRTVTHPGLEIQTLILKLEQLNASGAASCPA